MRWIIMKRILVGICAIVLAFIILNSCTWVPEPKGIWECTEVNIMINLDAEYPHGTIEIDGITTKIRCYWDVPDKLSFGDAQRVIEEGYHSEDQEYFSGTFQYKQEKLHLKVISSRIDTINPGDELVFTRVSDEEKVYSALEQLG